MPGIAGMTLFAADAAAFDVVSYLSVASGAIFALAIVAAGLFMLRSKPASTGQAPPSSALPLEDGAVPGEAGQPLAPPPSISVRSPLWNLALPALGVLLLGGVVVVTVLSFVQDFFKENLVPKMQNATTMPAQPFVGQAVTVSLYQPPTQTFPQFQYTPPTPPKIPTPYVGKNGFMRPR